ncbi:MAG: hypothetical protein WCB68_15325 [Pyrinomonadaceae bacterium]
MERADARLAGKMPALPGHALLQIAIEALLAPADSTCDGGAARL